MTDHAHIGAVLEAMETVERSENLTHAWTVAELGELQELSHLSASQIVAALQQAERDGVVTKATLHRPATTWNFFPRARKRKQYALATTAKETATP